MQRIRCYLKRMDWKILLLISAGVGLAGEGLCFAMQMQWWLAPLACLLGILLVTVQHVHFLWWLDERVTRELGPIFLRGRKETGISPEAKTDSTGMVLSVQGDKIVRTWA